MNNTIDLSKEELMKKIGKNTLIKKFFHYEIQLNTDSDRKVLLTLKEKNHPNFLGKGVNVIDIYSLVGSYIPYPNKEGKILYIGEACKVANPTGMRFYQHISPKPHEGKNRNVNYTLHRYYWNGFKISVDIFDIGDVSNKIRKDIERELISTHVKIYGALPIAQGTSGLLVSEISNIDESKVEEFFNIE